MHAVLDTNIVIDLLHFADPRARTLREAIDRGELTCFTDAAAIYERNLQTLRDLGIDGWRNLGVDTPTGESR